ncbi:MAG: nicotinate-nucleotide adenylyltransferase [Nitrospirota bacterium]
MKIGVFGGTFNPIHYGHLRASEEVRERLGFKKILFIPSKSPPLKEKNLANPAHRFEMSRIAISGNRFFELSDIEFRMKGKSYSVKTLEELKKTEAGADIFFILGIDSFLDIPHWWHPERLLGLTNFVIISRPGFKFIDLRSAHHIKIEEKILKKIDNADIPYYCANIGSNRYAILLRVTDMDISSTEIRKLIRQGKSINYLLPPKVKSYIILHRLYYPEDKRHTCEMV